MSHRHPTGIHVPWLLAADRPSSIWSPATAEVSFQNLNAVISHTKSGKLKALAVTSEKRGVVADVPDDGRTGHKDMAVSSWQALAAPKGLPADVKKAIHEAMMAALKDPETAKKLTDPGFEVTATSPEEFAKFLQLNWPDGRSFHRSRQDHADRRLAAAVSGTPVITERFGQGRCQCSAP